MKSNSCVCCKTCAHWDIDAARDKAGKIRHNKQVSCFWPMPVLPVAITPGRQAQIRMWAEGWTSASDGADCFCWEERL